MSLLLRRMASVPYPKGPLETALLQKMTEMAAGDARARIEVRNESAQHAGHEAMVGLPPSARIESHFKVSVVSDVFLGVPLRKRHQMIYGALKEEMTRIHALQIEARSHAEMDPLEGSSG